MQLPRKESVFLFEFQAQYFEYSHAFENYSWIGQIKHTTNGTASGSQPMRLYGAFLRLRAQAHDLWKWAAQIGE